MVEERLIPFALRLGDLSLHFLATLPPPAICQLFKGFGKPDFPAWGFIGRNLSFYHSLGKPGNYSPAFS